MMATVCFTYFKSLGPANLGAALYALRQQNFSRVESIIVVDNDTDDGIDTIQAVVDALRFPVPVRVLSFKHGDPARTHAWSTNVAVAAARSPWIIFTRADYLLHFQAVDKFFDVLAGWQLCELFITGNVYHLNVDVAACDKVAWRYAGPQVLRVLPGKEEDYTHIDAGVWMTSKAMFDRVGGLDERLSAWGHAQTHFQHKLYEAGARFVRIPEVLFYHPQHAASRDINLAHRQLAEQGINLRQMWERYEGTKPY